MTKCLHQKNVFWLKNTWTMLLKRIITLFLLLFCFTRAFPAVFVVTNNADSGTGTLREALTLAAANGTVEKDYINFNFPDVSEAGRTITIVSQLPDVSSNLVIDGTTQSGAAFGRSDAKIVLQPSNSSDIYDPFILTNVDGFEIYGMYVRDFIGVFPFEGSAVLYVHSSKNIQIGAPGKGNVFVNDGYILGSVYGHYFGNVIPPIFDGIENLTIYSNFFGFEPDGKSYRGMGFGYSAGLDISGCAGTIRIGGDNDNQRNIFGNIAMPIECRGTTPQTNHPTTFLIKNNYFNYNIDGQTAPLPNLNASNIFTIRITDNQPYTPELILPYKVYIFNNKIQAPCGITVGTVTGEIICQGNQVNNEDFPNKPAYAAGGISFRSKDKVLIGGEASGEANHFYNVGITASSPVSVLLQRNTDYCINDGYNIVWQPFGDLTESELPTINITGVTATSVSGKATPLSKVELFWDDDCAWCQPLTYIATVNTDANGNWRYDGAIQKGIIASAALNGYTSLFTTSTVYVGGKTVQYSCNNKGSITANVYKNTGGYQWKNEAGSIIGSNPDITDLVPGIYTLTTLNGTCSNTYTFKILDATPKIKADNKVITQPSCNNANGSVTGLYLDNGDVLEDAYLHGDYDIYTYKWIDQVGNIKSEGLDLTNVAAGIYHLEVTYKNQCTTTYGPVTLTNTTGPNINESAKTILSTPCGQSTGSITNITVTGTNPKYSWKNQQGQEVATTKDLINQPAGTYTLTVTDDTPCGPISSSAMEIPETNGITLNIPSSPVTNASCNQANGSVTGITAPGATQFQWRDANNNLVGSQLNLSNVPAGAYQLTAANSFGCSKTTPVYQILETPGTTYPNYNMALHNTCTGQTNGSIAITTDGLVKSLRWVDGQGQTITSSPQVNNLPAGTYKLYFTDQNNCESLYGSYVINVIPQLQIVAGSEQTTVDECALNTGSISSIQISGGLPPYSYQWYNADNALVSSTLNLTGVSAGSYKLVVNDAAACAAATAFYTITPQNSILSPPATHNIQLCTPGNALLTVDDPTSSFTFTYKLYESANSVTPLSIQNNGHFQVSVNANRSYYISKSKGSCESSRAEIQISVGLSTINIANTITPNGDGFNDYWKINGIENYPNAIIQLFNRYGQKIYESKGYQQPFDGTANGKPLPYGAYYYIINLNKNCNLLSGNLNIIR